jgi:hypothetical protein
MTIFEMHFELWRATGIVGVIGLAANNWWDMPYTSIGHCVGFVVSTTRGYWEHSAPKVWPPPTTYREIKE